MIESILYDFYYILWYFFFNERLVLVGFVFEVCILVVKLNILCDCVIKLVGEINKII